MRKWLKSSKLNKYHVLNINNKIYLIADNKVNKDVFSAVSKLQNVVTKGEHIVELTNKEEIAFLDAIRDSDTIIL